MDEETKDDNIVDTDSNEKEERKELLNNSS
jgi:hypothetical protein